MWQLVICFMLSLSIDSTSLQPGSLNVDQISQIREDIKYYQEQARGCPPDSLEQTIFWYKKAYASAIKIKDSLEMAQMAYSIAESHFKDGNYKKSNIFFLDAANQYFDIDSLKYVAFCYANLGKNYYHEYDFTKALYFYQKSLNICKKINSIEHLEAILLESIGSLNYLIGNLDESRAYHQKSLEIYLNKNDSLNIAKMFYLIGADYSGICIYDDAIEYFLKALLIFENLNYTEGIAAINHALSLIYLDFGLENASLSLNLKALKLVSSLESEYIIANIYKNLGTIFTKKGDWNKSIYYLNKAFNHEKIIKDKLNIVITIEKIGSHYFELEQYDKAEHYYSKSLKLLESLDDKWRKSKILINFGRLKIKQNNYLEAIFKINEGIRIARALKIKDVLLKGYKYAAECYNKMNSFEKAYFYKNLYISLKDSIYYNTSFKIANLQMRYQSIKQEKIHELLRKENLLQQEIIGKHKLRIWLLYGSILCVSLVSLFGYVKFLSKNRYAIRLFRKINKAISIQKEQEHKLIHQSVLTKIGELATFIIHDLRQPLQDIKLSAEEIEEGLSSPKVNYHLISNSLRDIFVDVERITCMTDYVINSTNKKSYDKEIEFDTNESITNAYRMIRRQFSRQKITLNLKLGTDLPHILGNPWKFEHSLLNILSNSCYAMDEARKFKENEYKEEFIIESYSTEGFVYIKVFDNGIGVIDSFRPKIFHPFKSTKEPGKGTGLGLSIVYEVVRQMHGKLEFSSSPFRGTIVTLIFPTASNRIKNKSMEDILRAQIENSSAR